MFKMDIRTNNGAFDPDCVFEIARILRQLADKIECSGKDNGSWDVPIRDSNGNRIGTAWHTPDAVQ